MARLAVLTSGGDAPGMNAAIRALTRSGVARGHEVFGVRHGYTGLIAGDLIPLSARAVGGIINRGGTVLGSSRCQTLKTEDGQQTAVAVLREHRIDALFVIGGNGSQAGALALARHGVRVLGVSSTIDNDLAGADPSIGVMTALDVAVEAIDRLRTTASAFERAFLVEVMGRHCGYLALLSGIAGGAEMIVLPEHEADPSTVLDRLVELRHYHRSHAIIVVAEGAVWHADRLAEYFRDHDSGVNFETRVTKLGHVQRGGVPGVFDRILATRLGAAAVDAFDRGSSHALLGLVDGRICATDLEQVNTHAKAFPDDLYNMAVTMAR